MKHVEKIKTNKAPGSDQILPEMLKNTSPAFTNFYLELFNTIFESHIFPDQWTKITVVPIYKKGEKSQPLNYHPISLVPCLAKVYMYIMHSHIFAWAVDNNILPKEQTAFQKNKGTENNLFILHSLIMLNKSKKAAKMYAFFADLKQACDSVNHDLLWNKLKIMGLSPKIIKNLAPFYALLSLKINTKNGWTKEIKINRGVLQGDPLSPLLFILFLADLPLIIPERCGIKHDSNIYKFLMYATKLCFWLQIDPA